MPYDESLADRVREAVAARADSREIRMFGGLCWTVNTHMAAGVIRDELLVPVGTDGVAEALARGAHEMTMGQRTMAGMVGVSEPSDEDLAAWVGPAVERALARPPKAPRKPKGA